MASPIEQRSPQSDNRVDNGVPSVFSPAKDHDLVEQKHRQIVDGACRLFFTKGFHRTTIREIALACGMSMGQLYHYISSKDDVLYLVYRHMQRLWFDYLQGLGVENIADPLEKLRQSIRHTLVFMLENRDLFLFVYTETKYLEQKHLKAVLDMDDRNVVGFWRRVLKGAGFSSGEADRLDFFANLISYLMVFQVLRGWNLKNGAELRYIDDLTDFILRGLGYESSNVH